MPVTVVARSTVHDNNSGQDIVTDYTYRNAFYDGEEKAFRGFALAEQLDRGDATAPTQVQRIIFDTGASDRSRKGLILQQDILGDGGTCGPDAAAAALAAATPLEAVPSISADYVGGSSVVSCYHRTVNRLATTTLANGLDGRNVSFSSIVQTDDLVYEGTSTYRRAKQIFAYDAYGNRIQEFNYGEVAADGSGFGLGGDERLTYTSYAVNLEQWILDRVAEVRRTDLAGTTASQQRRYYDGQAFVGLPLSQVTRGNLTRQEDNLGPAAGSGWVQSQRYRLDEYGNQTGRMDPNGALTATGQPEGGGHWTAITFDPVFHTFPVAEAIQLDGGRSLLITAEYHLGFGVITPRRRLQRPRTIVSATMLLADWRPSSSPVTAWRCQPKPLPTALALA